MTEHFECYKCDRSFSTEQDIPAFFCPFCGSVISDVVAEYETLIQEGVIIEK